MTVTLISITIGQNDIGDVVNDADARDEYLGNLSRSLRQSFSSAAIMIDVDTTASVYIDTDTGDDFEIRRAEESIDMIKTAVWNDCYWNN